MNQHHRIWLTFLMTLATQVWSFKVFKKNREGSLLFSNQNSKAVYTKKANNYRPFSCFFVRNNIFVLVFHKESLEPKLFSVIWLTTCHRKFKKIVTWNCLPMILLQWNSGLKPLQQIKIYSKSGQLVSHCKFLWVIIDHALSWCEHVKETWKSFSEKLKVELNVSYERNIPIYTWNHLQTIGIFLFVLYGGP